MIQESGIEKYKSVLIDEEFNSKGQRIYFNDFDHDGISEKVMIGNNPNNGYSFVNISNIHKKFICEWELHFDRVNRADILFGDCDNNGFDEIYAFTKVGDTIFINGFEPFTDSIITFKKQVDIADRYLGENDFDIYVGKVIDLDNDGFKEVVFVINSGYSISPRNLYIYSPRLDTIVKSPVSGAQLISPNIIDIDRDGDMEIILNTYAPGNMSDSSIPYNDHSSWLMVLDHNNQFLFEPVENPGHVSSVRVVPVTNKTQSKLVVFAQSGNIRSTKPNTLSLFNLSGQKIMSKSTEELGIKPPIRGLFYLNDNDGINSFVLDQRSILYEIDNQLNLKKVSKLDEDIRGLIENSFAGEDNLLFQSRNKQAIYLVKGGEFRHPIKFEILNEGGHLTYSEVFLSDGSPAYSIQTGKNWYLFTYNTNLFFYLRFPIYLFIAAFVFLLITFIKKVQRDQIIKKHENEKKVLQWQLTSMKNQLNPHFTLNVLNSIGGLSNKNQEEADYYFGKYAKLIRQILMGADKISVSLNEELEFIRNYLDLEQFRYGNRFSYEISYANAKNLDREIPRMLIHTFVENAIKHGLKHLKSEGLLKINISEDINKVVIDISDNGIGRKAAKEMRQESTGKGMEIVEQMIEIYNQINNTNISYRISDGKDDKGKAVGTIVRVSLPKK